jgi:hypothetical protein
MFDKARMKSVCEFIPKGVTTPFAGPCADPKHYWLLSIPRKIA